MPDQQQQQQIPIDGHAHALLNVMISHDEENFQFLMASGGPARLYLASPKHAKRIALLLGRQLADYEKKYGEIKAELPKAPKGTAEEEVGFKVPAK
jgi:hypothetical protein